MSLKCSKFSYKHFSSAMLSDVVSAIILKPVTANSILLKKKMFATEEKGFIKGNIY